MCPAGVTVTATRGARRSRPSAGSLGEVPAKKEPKAGSELAPPARSWLGADSELAPMALNLLPPLIGVRCPDCGKDKSSGNGWFLATTAAGRSAAVFFNQTGSGRARFEVAPNGRINPKVTPREAESGETCRCSNCGGKWNAGRLVAEKPKPGVVVSVDPEYNSLMVDLLSDVQPSSDGTVRGASIGELRARTPRTARHSSLRPCSEEDWSLHSLAHRKAVRTPTSASGRRCRRSTPMGSCRQPTRRALLLRPSGAVYRGRLCQSVSRHRQHRRPAGSCGGCRRCQK